MVEVREAKTREEAADLIRGLWHKYGLIVVGNVVFFALLYFIQYRPNSRENRATELLTMAQREETERHLEAAEALYQKVVSDYDDCAAFDIASERLPKVRKLAKQKRAAQPPLPESCAPEIDIKEVLELKPTLYMAELVAGHYPEIEATERERYFKVLDDYVWLSLNHDQVPLKKLKESPVFRAEELRKRYFALKADVRFAPDWLYDDFFVKNAGFYTLHNVVIDLSVSQGEQTKQASIRVPKLNPDEEVLVLEYNVAKDAGSVEVKAKLASDEGKLNWTQRL